MSHPLSPSGGDWTGVSGQSWTAPAAASDVATIRPAAPAQLSVRVTLSLWAYLVGNRRSELVLALISGGFLTVTGGVLATGPAGTVHSQRYGEVDGHLLGWSSLAIGLFLLAYLPFSVRRQLGDGFAAGADHHGVYLRPHLDKSRVLFLPWSRVEMVSVRRWHGPQLVIKPRDPGIERQFDLVPRGRLQDRAGTALAQRRRIKRLGTNIHAPIAGQDAAEILNALRYQAAGRAPVESM